MHFPAVSPKLVAGINLAAMAVGSFLFVVGLQGNVLAPVGLCLVLPSLVPYGLAQERYSRLEPHVFDSICIFGVVGQLATGGCGAWLVAHARPYPLVLGAAVLVLFCANLLFLVHLLSGRRRSGSG